MKLPNGERASVELLKLREYCLSPSHPRGKHKARVFASILGFTAGDAERLREARLVAAREHAAVVGEADGFGQRYVIDFPLAGPAGKATVRSCWIILRGQEDPRLSSCYVL